MVGTSTHVPSYCTDGAFMWMSLIYLMLIAFLPVPSGTLARYGSEFPAVEFFCDYFPIGGHCRVGDMAVRNLQPAFD